jgi:hypothetical protein
MVWQIDLRNVHIQRLNALSMLVPGVSLALWWIRTSDDYIQYVAIPYIFVCICSFNYHNDYANNNKPNLRYLRYDITAQQILAYASLLVVPSNAITVTFLMMLFPIITTGNLNNEVESELVLGANILTIIIMGFHYSFKCGIYWILALGLFLAPTKYNGVLWHFACHLAIHTAGVDLLEMNASS